MATSPAASLPGASLPGTSSPGTSSRSSRRAAWLALGGIALVALAFRLLGFERVLLPEGEVVLHFADAQYHARRAAWILHDFPRIPFFDRYLNHPDGAWIPYPPLYHFAVAAAAWLAGGTAGQLERIAAVSPALLGSLAVVPIHWIGTQLRGPALGLGAAALYAVLPLPVRYSEIGNFDHHALVAPLGALLIGLYAATLSECARGRRLVALHVGLTATRLALLATWQGSLLYLGLGELALVAHGAYRGDRARLRAQGVSALATAAGIAPLVAVSGTVVGGPFSAVELSRLQPTAYLAAAAVCAALVALEAWRPTSGPWAARARLLRAAGVVACLGAVLLALPGPRTGLARAFAWLSMADSFGGGNFEQRALLSSARGGSRAFGESMFGAWVYAIPLVPLAFLAEARRRRAPAPLLFLALWSGVTGALALGQVRYGNDFAAVGALGFALLAAAAGRGLARLLPGSGTSARPVAIAVAIGVLALWPGYARTHAGPVARSLAHLRGEAQHHDLARSSFEVSLYRFARQVWRATPSTAGFHDSAQRPEYAVLAPPRIGNALVHVGRRATPASNFGPYAGPERFAAARGFFDLTEEADALARAEELDSRYVVTSSVETANVGSIGQLLHADDGAARAGHAHLGSFRLLVEGPPGGVAVGAQGAQLGNPVPYKLFERVTGAELAVAAPPGETVVAHLDLRTPGGRRFRWTARGRADADGLARLRVPYPTAPPLQGRALLHTRAEGPYRVRVAGRTLEARVAEADVIEGRRILVKSGGGP